MEGLPASDAAAQRVLVVDDHAGFRAGVRAILEQGPFRVVGEAEDGGSALAAFERLRPDLILLDIDLPDLDGFEVASRLRAVDQRLVIVLVSSRDASDYGGRVERSEAHAFIAKAHLTSAVLASVVA